MKWLDDAPDSWEQVPEDPPAVAGDGLSTETHDDGVLIHEVGGEDDGAYIYAREGERSLEELA